MATKTTPQEIIDLGFVCEQFGVASASFTAWLQAVLDEQEALLSDRVTAATVATASLLTHVKRAEKCMAGAELMQRRINRISGNVDADSAIIIAQLKKARQDYLDEAERIIPRLLAGSVSDGADFAFGQNTSSHFDSDAAVT